MNILPLPPVIVGAAGLPLAQTKGAEADRATQDTAAQQRQVQADAQAEMAAGIGATEEQSGSDADRDADGRRLWETPPAGPHQQPAGDGAAGQRRSRDASGQCGGQLDLSG